jgi:hypothetical protein
VGDDDHRRLPRETPVRVAVQVHEVGPQPVLELEQPAARAVDVVPGILLPLERERRLVEAGGSRAGERGALVVVERPAHRRELDLDPVRRESVGEVERVRPHAADGVGRHQDPHRP